MADRTWDRAVFASLDSAGTFTFIDYQHETHGTENLTSTEAIMGHGHHVGSGGGASFSYSAYDYDEVIRTHTQADDLTTYTGNGYTTLDGYWIRSETTDSLLTHMEIGSGLSAGWSDDFTSSHAYILTIVNANGSDSWSWDVDAEWFASDFFNLEAPAPHRPHAQTALRSRGYPLREEP